MTKNSFTPFKITSKDGTKLHGNYLKPSESPVAILYFVHGLGSHSGRFLQSTCLFADKNIASIGVDLRGNGLSEGQRGHINVLSEYMEDIDACIEYSHRFISPDIPKIIMGNSMGGAVALNYALSSSTPFIGIIMAAPWLQLTKPIGWLKYSTMAILSKIMPRFTFSSKVRPPQTLEDNEKPADYEEDELIHKIISARLFMIIDRLGKHILHQIDCFTPTLILHSTNDPVTAYKASEQLCKKHELTTQLITLDLFTHEVPFEEDNKVSIEVEKFIDKLLSNYGKFQD